MIKFMDLVHKTGETNLTGVYLGIVSEGEKPHSKNIVVRRFNKFFGEEIIRNVPDNGFKIVNDICLFYYDGTGNESLIDEITSGVRGLSERMDRMRDSYEMQVSVAEEARKHAETNVYDSLKKAQDITDAKGDKKQSFSRHRFPQFAGDEE